MNDLVSIIIPVYNEQKYLNACIDSIINQTYKNIEIIIIDDGSQELVASLCDQIAISDSRIKVLHKKNEGLSAARLSGFEMSKGNWIMFVDDDDVIPEDTVHNLLQGERRNVEIIAGRRMDLIEVDLFELEDAELHIDYYSGREVCEKLGKDRQATIITPLWGKLYRREFLEKFDLYRYRDVCPTIFFEDVLMTPILYANAENIAIINKVVYLHREVKTSISRSGKLTSFYYEQIESGNILLEYVKERELVELYAYELGIYMGSILRIWCLIDYVQLQNELVYTYKNKIEKYYKKYIRDYCNKSYDAYWKKILYRCFGINKKIWGHLVYRIYFKRNKR